MTEALRVYRRSELEAIKPTIDSAGCLYRYDQIWNKGVDDSSDVALVGIAFAAIKHRYILSLVDQQLSQDFELSRTAFVDGVASVQTPSRLLPEVRTLWDFHAEAFELPLERFVAAEERGTAGDVGFTPDLVLAHPERNELEIIDDKSGWHPPMTEDQLRGLFQARVYSRYALDRWPNFTSYRFTLHAVRFRKSVSVVFPPSELDAVEVEVRGAIAVIQEAHRTGQWPATAGPSCHFCELACPLVDQAITWPKRLTVEQISQLGAWLLVAEKQLRSAKKLMKDSCAVYGPCVVNGMEWANRPSVSKAYPIDALIDVLKVRGVMGAFEGAAAQELTISHSALAKLFKVYPGLEDDLRSVAKEKTTYRFSAKHPEFGVEGDEE